MTTFLALLGSIVPTIYAGLILQPRVDNWSPATIGLVFALANLVWLLIQLAIVHRKRALPKEYTDRLLWFACFSSLIAMVLTSILGIWLSGRLLVYAAAGMFGGPMFNHFRNLFETCKSAPRKP